MELRHLVLKDLVLQYQTTKDKEIFARILKRCDGLLIATIQRNLWRKGLEKPSAKELYHAAIIGLHRAVLSSPIDEHPDKVVARIVAYVKLELITQFCKKEASPSLSDPNNLHKCCKVEDFQDPAYINCEFKIIMDLLKKAVEQKIVSNQELDIFLERKMYDVGYHVIGQRLGLTRDAVRKKLLAIEKRILEWIKTQKI